MARLRGPGDQSREGEKVTASFRKIVMAASARANGSRYISREEMPVQAFKNNWGQPGERFAIVDEFAPIRFLSREEFALMKELNPNLIEMKAGDIVYLTEPPKRREPLPPH